MKVLKFLVVLPVGSFPTNVADVKKIKVKPAGYANWAGLTKFYDNLPSLTRQKIENSKKPATGKAAENSKRGERRAVDVKDWFKTLSGNRTDSINLTKGKGSGIASKGKDDRQKRMVMITFLCEKEV